MATTAMTPSAGLCGESHSLGGGAPLVSASLDSLPPSVPLPHSIDFLNFDVDDGDDTDDDTAPAVPAVPAVPAC